MQDIVCHTLHLIGLINKSPSHKLDNSIVLQLIILVHESGHTR
jgi:hypothetical protein